MKLKDAKKGMLVYISRNCLITSAKHGWSSTMDQYKGTEQIIKDVGVKGVFILGWQWNAEDLSIIKKEKIKEQFFNTDKIWA